MVLFFGVCLAWLRAMAMPEIALTAAEETWLREHPVIRVAYDPAWPPFSFRDRTGNFIGLDADVLRLLEVRLDVRFERVHYRDWTEVYAKARGHEVDFLVGTALTPERMQSFQFSSPYQALPVGIITLNDQPFLWSVLDLAGRKVAGVKGYAPTELLEREYPEMEIVYTETIADAFELVADGEADAVITNLVNASFIIKTRGLSNLKIAGIMPDTFDLRYAVRRDWPELVSILNKGIASITRADLQAINHRWVRVDYANVIRWDLVWKIGGAVLVVLGTVIGFLVWHYRAVSCELVKRKELQLALEATNARLNLANTQLEARHQEIASLMSVAAHDLRSPLTAFSISAQILKKSDDPHIRGMGETMAASARQMCQLVEDLLDVHALEEGKREFAVARVNPADLVLESCAALTMLALGKGIRLDASGIVLNCGEVAADPGALRQVFDNLISNAVKFSPLGKRVTVRVGRWNEYVRCEVEDEGPGVPANERERIFTKYTRGSAQPTAGEKSTGLGLAIVREVVAAMNGRVWCEDGEAGGACFVVALPLASVGVGTNA